MKIFIPLFIIIFNLMGNINSQRYLRDFQDINRINHK